MGERITAKMKPQEKNAKRGFWNRSRFLQLAALIGVIALSILLVTQRSRFAQLESYGPYPYLGVFLISALSSASIVVPVPGLVIVAALGCVLNPLLVGIVSGLGGTLGELTGYALGYGGRLALEEARLYPSMVKWMSRWGSLTIWLLALIPNPLFDIAGATAGALRFALWKFVLFGALGRIPKHIAVAYLGTWILGWLPFE